jgi:hypothetical protein
MTSRAALTGKLFRARDAIDSGLLTAEHLRGKAWQRVFQGIYADRTLPITHAMRCAAAMAFLLRDDATLAGRSAAMMYGVRMDDLQCPVEVLIPATAARCRHDGIVIHRCDLADDEVGRVNRLKVTTPVRTCWDLSQWLDVVESVVWLDRLLALGRISAGELADYVRRRRETTVRGVRKFERVMSLVDSRAESPPESRLRVRLVLAGVPRPESQFSIVDANGQFVARVDLAWPRLRVAVEYDGLWHVGSAGQMHADRRRLNALVGLGWVVLHVTSVRLRDDFDAVVAEVRAALRH